MQDQIAPLKERQGNYAPLLAELTASGQNEVSLTAADSRKMKGAHGEHLLGDNVPGAVDAQHHLCQSDVVGLGPFPRNAEAPRPQRGTQR